MTNEDGIISSVAQESRLFVFDNLNLAFKLILPLLPFIIICGTGENLIAAHYEDGYSPFAYINQIFFGVFAISWHKLVMKGHNSEYKTSLWTLNKNDFKFLGVILLLSLPTELFNIFHIEASGFFILILFAALILITWLSLRISLYFPAAAYGEPITLKEAFIYGEGLPMRIFLSSFLALWRFYIVIIIVAVLNVFLLLQTKSDLLLLPQYIVTLIAYTIVSATAATVLSKYYLIWRKELSLEIA